MRVFILEDDRPTAESVTELLTLSGPFKVVGWARTEMQSVEWMQANDGGWDLALLDLLVPDGSGFSVLQRLKSLKRPGRAIVVSDFLTPAVREQCIKLGATEAFSKSDVAAMVDYLRSLADARGLAVLPPRTGVNRNPDTDPDGGPSV